MQRGKTSMYKKISSCRICGSKKIQKYLDLGKMPLANSLIRPEKTGRKELVFPLEVLFCPECALSQLSVVVDPKALFSDYVYRSSVSKTFRNHCREMAADFKKIIGRKKERPFVLDIASNDGCLLREFRGENYRVLGIEPAENLAHLAEEEGLDTMAVFWDKKTAQKISREIGVPDVITATNVLAHVDDVHSFVGAVSEILGRENFFVVEVPTAANIIQKNEFDTIYHEHLSYFLLKPLLELFSRNGLEVFDAQMLEIHGGTLRVFAAKKGSVFRVNNKNIQKVLESEKKAKLYDFGTYLPLSKNISRLKADTIALLDKIKKEGKTIAAYGAAAKGNTLLNYYGIGKQYLDFIIDDTPEKQHCFTPGQHIPIFPSGYLEEKKPDYILLLAWNFFRELIDRIPKHRLRGGKYIIPIPEPRVI